MLIVSGICDAFDGTIAKKLRKNIKDDYGIQLDSLADILSSGIFPIIICISMGFNKNVDIIIYCIFIICGITRLAYFNVNTKNETTCFTGLPITCTTIILPIIYNLKNEVLFMSVLLLLSILFVSNIKIKKPNLKTKLVLSLMGIIFIVYMNIVGV